MVKESLIRKSQSDKKNYRLITLDNGLRALLISELKESATSLVPPGVAALQKQRFISESSDAGSSDMDESDTTESEGEESEEILSAEELDEEPRKSKKPPNKAKKQAAAALCIGVGSFSDLERIPGLAHFLEHMVFMGSEKYPDENKFDAFIRLHGGYDNASTDAERTVFQFEIQPKQFREALDIWAQFFISPLLKQDSVDREVKAVDAEFDMALNSDDCRKEQMLCSIFSKKSPMSKFMWGNKMSLKTKPEKEGIDVYGALKKFHKDYYSSHFMTLVVQSPEELDTLEEWAKEIFNDIPCNNNPLPTFASATMNNSSMEVYKITPVGNVQEIMLTWVLPPQQKFYKTKPLHYISWLIGHEGKGSILSLLKKYNLALALCGGNEETGFEQNTTCSLFHITITLTNKGYSQYCEVIDIVFQYLTMLRNEEPNERVFKEIQKIEDIDFMFQEEESPIENAVKQAGNIHLYPEEDILTGDSLLFEYDPECIKNALKELNPESCIIFLSSKEHKNGANCTAVKKEPWFGTSYFVEDIPGEWKKKWSDSEEKGTVDPNLHLPAPNKFIAERFELKEVDEETKKLKYPQLISGPETGYKLWFRQDHHFCLPKAYIRFNLVNPLSLQTPQDNICLELLVHLIIYNLAEVAYDADAASLAYHAQVSDNGGLVLKFSGYNDKLPLLLDAFADHLVNFKTTVEDFNQHLLEHMRMYYNTLIKPAKLAKNLRLTILEKNRWSSIDKYEACRTLTYEQFMTFVEQFLSSLYVESLVQGNYKSDEANEIIANFVKKLNCKLLTKDQIISPRVIKLGDSPKICKVKGLNPTDDCSKITTYYQVGQNDTDQSAMMMLLEAVMDEPCFNILRTIKQLGYSVFTEHHNTAGILGLTVNVLTQNSKFSTEKASAEMKDFVTKEMTEILKNMKQEEFEAQVASTIAVLKNDDTHLGEEVDRNWHEITTQDYNFDRIEREVRFLESCTLEDLSNFFQSSCIVNDKILEIQVKGNTPPAQVNSNSSDEIQKDKKLQEPISKGQEPGDSSAPPYLALEFLQCEGGAPENNVVYLTSIENMKNSSSYYPISHVIAK